MTFNICTGGQHHGLAVLHAEPDKASGVYSLAGLAGLEMVCAVGAVGDGDRAVHRLIGCYDFAAHHGMNALDALTHRPFPSPALHGEASIAQDDVVNVGDDTPTLPYRVPALCRFQYTSVIGRPLSRTR